MQFFISQELTKIIKNSKIKNTLRKENRAMLRLRPYKSCDARYISKWINDEKSFYQWSAGKLGEYPLTEERLDNHYESNKYNPNFFPMVAIDDEGIPRGHMIMRYLPKKEEESTYDLKNLRFGFIIVDSSVRGKGYGREMLKLAFKYAFEILKVERISLGVFANNPSAIKCYERAGMVPVKDGIEKYTLMNEEWECIEYNLFREQSF